MRVRVELLYDVEWKNKSALVAASRFFVPLSTGLYNLLYVCPSSHLSREGHAIEMSRVESVESSLSSGTVRIAGSLCSFKNP